MRPWVQPNLVLAHTLKTQVDISLLSHKELLAFFINLYNALIIHATCTIGAPASDLERVRFFSRDAAYIIGGHVYAADDIENGVLRRNAAPASSLFSLMGMPKLASGVWSKGDPRLSKASVVCLLHKFIEAQPY
jgi:hypothetical protein